MVSSTPAQAAGYWRCTYGKVCLFEHSWGDGEFYEVPTCGMNVLPRHWYNRVSSVKTHGNPVTLYYSHTDAIGRVAANVETNLALWENDKMNKVYVSC